MQIFINSVYLLFLPYFNQNQNVPKMNKIYFFFFLIFFQLVFQVVFQIFLDLFMVEKVMMAFNVKKIIYSWLILVFIFIFFIDVDLYFVPFVLI